MLSYSCLVILDGNDIDDTEISINSRLDKLLKSYSSQLQLDPYIIMSKEQIQFEFNRFKNEIDKLIKNNKFSFDEDPTKYNLEEFAKKWLGFSSFDKDGNVISTFNKFATFSEFQIGGKYKGYLYDKQGKPINYGRIKDINWNLVNRRFRSRAINNWKKSQSQENEILRLVLYATDGNISEAEYIAIHSKFYTDAVLTKEGIWEDSIFKFSISNKGLVLQKSNDYLKYSWKQNFYDRFIKNLDENDIIVVLDMKY